MQSPQKIPATPCSDFHVALINMPFAMADRPSIQIGLLAAIARNAGFVVDPYHLNLELAARIPDAYDGLCSHRGRMTGEWLFSIAAFDDQVQLDDQQYYRAFPEELGWAAKGGKDAAYLSMLRHELLPRFIEECLAMANWGQYQVIGFTSTFQQNTASLALARRIRNAYPQVRIVFGGANMEGQMGQEYAHAFPFLDHVVIGEGDTVFPQLLRRLAFGEPIGDLQGLTHHNGSGICCTGQAPPFHDLDLLPTPSYDEYFERHERLGLALRKGFVFAIPFESSRGCWWGEKHHCTFCGLNGLGMGYRVKKPDRVLAELSELADKHGVTMFQATDNIVDLKYITRFFAKIEETRSDYEFFYETKSNLTQEQIRTMRRGGIRWLQPGIESFSTHVLQLMQKGCTMLQNLRTLKWCRYYRIRVGWNLLWGFPGEREEDYSQECELLKLIGHLEPPNACGRIWIERFSPVYYDSERFPARAVTPEASYAYVYPNYVDLEKAAYFFNGELEGTLPESIHEPTLQLVEKWKAQWSSSTPQALLYRRTMDAILIDDNRETGMRGTHIFHGPLANLYDFCGVTMRTVEQGAEYLSACQGGREFACEEVKWALDEFCRRGFMVSEDNRYFSLALPANPNW
jgi:ribosomal peptide maturation radical SAM protein 1